MNKIIIAIFVCILLVSCNAGIDLGNLSNEIALQPSLVVPIGGASVTLGDILLNNNTSDKIVIGDGVEIYYQDLDTIRFRCSNLNLLDNVKTLNKNYVFKSYGVSVNEVIPPNTHLPAISSLEELKLGVNQQPASERIDSVLINKAVLLVTVSQTSVNVPSTNILATITFPSKQVKMLNPGQSNSVSFRPSAYGVPSQIELTNFMLYLVNDGSSIPITINYDVYTGSSETTFTDNSALSTKIELNKMDFDVAYGYFEPTILPAPVYQWKFNLFKNAPDGLLKLTNPQIDITAESNIGTYLRIQIDSLKSFVSSNSSLKPVYAWFEGHTTNSTSEVFDHKPESPGAWIIKNFKTFDKDWGETDQLFGNVNKPDMLGYKFTPFLDRALIENDPTPNFVTSDPQINVYMKTTIPLQLNPGSYYEYNDTIKNILDSTASVTNITDYIKSASLILNMTNGLPVKIQFTMKLLDSLNVEINTDFEKNYFILAGKVDADGIVQPGNETKQTISVLLTKQQLSAIRGARKIAYSLKVDGEDIDSNIFFTKFNIFDLKVGLFFKGNVNTQF